LKVFDPIECDQDLIARYRHLDSPPESPSSPPQYKRKDTLSQYDILQKNTKC
jgi:hypothetical protein